MWDKKIICLGKIGGPRPQPEIVFRDVIQYGVFVPGIFRQNLRALMKMMSKGPRVVFDARVLWLPKKVPGVFQMKN